MKKKNTHVDNVIAYVDDLTLNKASVNECVYNLINLLHDIFDETCKRETCIPCNNCPVHTNTRSKAHEFKPWFNEVFTKLYNSYREL